MPIDKVGDHPDQNPFFVNLLIKLPQFMRSKSAAVKT